MSSNAKILIATILLIFTFSSLIVWVGINARALDQIAYANQQRNREVDLVKLDVNYRQQTKLIVARFVQIGDGAAEHQVAELRQELLALIVPGKFKELHKNLVFALDQRLAFIQKGNQDKKLASENAVNKAKSEYAWLN